MTAQPPDLLTFLAARFDDDEGMARILKSSQAMAQVEAHRRIVAEHGDGRSSENLPAFCFTCSDDEHLVDLPCPTLRHLASVYATHPAFDPSWRA